MVELQQTKTKPISFYVIRNLLQEAKVESVNKRSKLHFKIKSFSIVYRKMMAWLQNSR